MSAIARHAVLPRSIAWAYCVALLILLLAPFRFYIPFRQAPNGVRWLEDTPGIELISNGIVTSVSPATQLYHSLVSSPGFSLEVWIAPSDLNQRGPARIVTYSLDKSLRNLTLGQERDALVLRLRTTETDLNGRRPQTVVDDVFSTVDPTHLVVTYDHTKTSVYVDGQLKGQVTAVGGRFENWNAEYRFALGNELTGNRPWRGSIYSVAIYRRVLSQDEIRKGSLLEPPEGPAASSRADEGLVALYTFDEGIGAVVHDRRDTSTPLDLTIPEFVVTSSEPFLHPPYRYVDLRFLTLKKVSDIVLNVVLFVPFGFMFCASMRSRSVARTLVIVVMGLSLSLSAEVAQYFIRGRESSLGDVLHNGIGTAVGVLIATIGASALAGVRKTTASDPHHSPP